MARGLLSLPASEPLKGVEFLQLAPGRVHSDLLLNPLVALGVLTLIEGVFVEELQGSCAGDNERLLRFRVFGVQVDAHGVFG